MQKSPQELEAEFDLLIEDFRLATRGLFTRREQDFENHVAGVRVTQKSIFPQREALS